MTVPEGRAPGPWPGLPGSEESLLRDEPRPGQLINAAELQWLWTLLVSSTIKFVPQCFPGRGTVPATMALEAASHLPVLPAIGHLW